MKVTTVLISALAVAASGCGSIRYGDSTAKETVTIDWGSYDLQTFAQHMVDSLVADPALSYLDASGKTEDKRIIVYMGGVENETEEHINMNSLEDKIESASLKTGKFRFVAGQPGQDEIGEQVRFQQGSGRVREDMRKAFGKQLGADVVLYGSLYDIRKKRGRSLESGGTKTKDLYYQFVLKCVNIETGELIWTDEAEIRKTQVVGLFGSG